jgi:type II secretory pathway pseudopilin PulG
VQRTNQSGFTLFEIGLAIVIICLLATFVVIGQNFTIYFQVNRLEHDFRSIQTAIYDSRDGVRSKHGVARKVSLHLQDSAIPGNNSNLNMIADRNWNSASGEDFKLWYKVHPPGFAQGSTDANLNVYVPPKLQLPGGVVEISETYNEPIPGFKGNYSICANNIAGKLVKQLDLVLDDGNTASGSMMVSNSVGGTAIATDSIISSSVYMVCLEVL